MKFLDVLTVQISSTQGRIGGGGGDKVHSLPYTVHDNYDGVIAVHVDEPQLLLTVEYPLTMSLTNFLVQLTNSLLPTLSHSLPTLPTLTDFPTVLNYHNILEPYTSPQVN